MAVHPPEGTPTVPPPPPPPAGTTTTIDLMIVFNSATTTIYGAAAVPAEAQNAIDRTNKALLDSKTNVQLRLVHVEQVPDEEIAANGDDNLGRLMRSQKVAQLRDQYGADLVQAWGTYPSVCGQGYQQVKGTMPSQYGFSVINGARKDKQCVAGVGVAHELGHNLAAGHDRSADHAEGKPGDAYGYVDLQHQFLDIMSYPSASARRPAAPGRGSTPTRMSCSRATPSVGPAPRTTPATSASTAWLPPSTGPPRSDPTSGRGTRPSSARSRTRTGPMPRCQI